ncbi:hypothetical protein E2542_SST28005 [Spatholobus suberectus]|nr:hypothetical protein E2542_SST28005 [Spatholobus suberectus]
MLTAPLWRQWHSCKVDLRARLSAPEQEPRNPKGRATPENDHRRARRCLILLPCRIPSPSPISYGRLTEATRPQHRRAKPVAARTNCDSITSQTPTPPRA